MKPNHNPVLYAALAVLTIGASACIFIYQQSDDEGSLERPDLASGLVVKPENCEIASTADAKTLLTRLLPNATILTAEPFHLTDRTCLLEVEMLANKDDQSTRGFVYVLPSGKEFLNGPLMDKRSKVSLASQQDDTIDKALADQREALAQAGLLPAHEIPAANQSSQVTKHNASSLPEFTQAPLVSQTPATALPTAEELRAKFDSDLLTLPSIRSPAPGKTVNVLLDPLCSQCAKLFLSSESLIEDHKIQFNWIPMYTSDLGWMMSALVVKTAKNDQAGAYKLLSKMMQNQWRAEDYSTEIAALTEADYREVKRTLIVFRDLSKYIPNLGTPVVSFKKPDNTFEVIKGVPLASDWFALGTSKAEPPALQLGQ